MRAPGDPGRAIPVGRDDLAAFLLGVVESGALVGESPFLSYEQRAKRS